MEFSSDSPANRYSARILREFVDLRFALQEFERERDAVVAGSEATAHVEFLKIRAKAEFRTQAAIVRLDVHAFDTEQYARTAVDDHGTRLLRRFGDLVKSLMLPLKPQSPEDYDMDESIRMVDDVGAILERTLVNNAGEITSRIDSGRGLF